MALWHFVLGSNPPAVIKLSCKTLDWCSKVKYLGLYLISGINFRIDLNAATQKYYGCFNYQVCDTETD